MRLFTKTEKQEIVRSYEKSEDNEAQIQILADLNVCDPSDVIRVLKEAEYVDSAGCLISPTSGRSKASLIVDKDRIDGEADWPKKVSKPRVKKTNWTPDKVRKLWQLKDEGYTNAKIGESFGVSATAIQQTMIRYPRDTVITSEIVNPGKPILIEDCKDDKMSQLLDLQMHINCLGGWFERYLLSIGLEIGEDGNMYPVSECGTGGFSQGYLIGNAASELHIVKERIDSIVG